MRKLIVAVTLVMGFMGTAHAVDMIDPRSVPHSDYEISNGSDVSIPHNRAIHI